MMPPPSRLLALVAAAALALGYLALSPEGPSPPARAAVLPDADADPSSPPRRLAGLGGTIIDPKTVLPREAVVPPPYDAPGRPDWDDVDPDLKFNCGHYKCFFLSKSDPSRGYMLEVGRVDGLAMGEYNYAERLKREHGIRHFLLGPPYDATMPDFFLEAAIAQGQHSMPLSKGRFDQMRDVVVFESQTAPEGSRTFKCYGNLLRYITLDAVLRDGGPGVGATLLDELAKAVKLIQTHSGKSLVEHFQVMIDPEGLIYHIDFDRALHRKGYPLPAKQVGDKVPGMVQCLEDAMEYVRKAIGPDVISDVE